MLRYILLLCAIAALASPGSAQARTSGHAPTINWHFDSQIMQGDPNTPTGSITDRDGDLVSVHVVWGDAMGGDNADGEADAVTNWHSPRRQGAHAMPQDMDSVNDPCFNWVGRVHASVTARDRAGHVARHTYTFTVVADPDWPGPDVPVIDVSPGHDGVVEIGVGT